MGVGHHWLPAKCPLPSPPSSRQGTGKGTQYSPVETDAFSQGVGDEDCYHQAIDGNDTSHDHWDNGLHDQLWPHDRHGRYTSAALGCTIGSAQGWGWEEKR